MKSGTRFARHVRVQLFATTAVVAMLIAAPVQAQEKRQFAIPAEDAAAAVPTLGRQSGLQISAAIDDLNGVRTNEVRGEYAPLDAVRKLVDGTGLQIIQTSDRAITLRRGTLVPVPVPGLRPVAAAAPQLRMPSDQAPEEIFVTGSRIKRAGFDTLQAALVTDASEIERRGYTNVIDALQATPGFGVPGSSQLSSSQGRNGIGQSYANFFGLGSQRTLTLVDGKRFVSSNTPGTGSNASPGSQVDLNLIPAGLVERIETVAIGGAPVYGSDAIAGTVNVILKQHYQGVEGSFQYGLSDHGDARNKTVRGMVGTDFAGGRGNFVIAAEYNKADGLVYANRYDLRNLVANPANTSNTDGIAAQYYARNVRFAFMTEGGLPYTGKPSDIPGLSNNYIFDSAGRPQQFARDGTLVPFNVGQVVQASSGIPILSSGGDGVNAADHFSLLTPTERKLANFNAHYELTDNIRAYVQIAAARSEATLLSDLTSIVAPNIVASPSLTIQTTNPFLSAQARGVLQANGLTSFKLARNLNDIVDTMPAQIAEDMVRIVGGLDGKFGAFNGEQWSWNLSYNYGYNRNFSTDTYIDPTRLQNAVNAVRDASGNIVCASGGSCVPINLFGQNAASQDAINYIINRGSGLTKNYQGVINANMSGNLPISVGAPIAFNVGYEHRREASSFSPNYGFTLGDQLDGVPGYSAVQGSFNTNEVYGETVIPLVAPDNNWSVIKAASLEGAVRYVDHSITGGATTWSAGGRISPRLGGIGDGLTFRGVFTRSIRSPAITELFLPASGSLGGITDPCDANSINLGPNPVSRRANCTAALSGSGAAGAGTFRSTTRNVSVAGTQSGNPNLKNESADSWSVGFVYSPPAIPRFNLALDWSHIDLTDGIQLLSINTVLSTCYDSTNYPANPACSQFRRLTPQQAAGTIRVAGDIAAGYVTGYFNTSELVYSGLIASADYAFDVRDVVSAWSDGGSISLSAKLIYTGNYDQTQFVGGPIVSGVGTIGLPHWRAQVNANYAWHDFDGGVQVLWTGAVVSDKTATPEVVSDFRISPYTLVNANVGWQFTPNLRAQVSVQNLFDTAMPEVAIATRAFSTYDPLGRRYLFKLSAKF
jgi:outer membrane receptor protein involved in Fe transport